MDGGGAPPACLGSRQLSLSVGDERIRSRTPASQPVHTGREQKCGHERLHAGTPTPMKTMCHVSDTRSPLLGMSARVARTRARAAHAHTQRRITTRARAGSPSARAHPRTACAACARAEPPPPGVSVLFLGLNRSWGPDRGRRGEGGRGRGRCRVRAEERASLSRAAPHRRPNPKSLERVAMALSRGADATPLRSACDVIRFRARRASHRTPRADLPGRPRSAVSGTSNIFCGVSQKPN